jgi:predicted membrane protein
MIELSLLVFAISCVALVLRIRKRMFEKIQHHDHAWYEHVSFGQKVKRYKQVYGVDRKFVVLQIMMVVTALVWSAYFVVFVKNFHITR